MSAESALYAGGSWSCLGVGGGVVIVLSCVRPIRHLLIMLLP